MSFKIESLRLKNFKVFKNASMQNIPRLTAVVGANGSGKSTLFDVFGFLHDAMASNVQVALSKRGGFKELRTREAKGAIEIEIKFRFKIKTNKTQKTPLATYFLAIQEQDGQVVIEKEELSYRRGSHGKPWKFLSFSQGEGEAVSNEFADVADESKLTREKQSLAKANILAIKGLAQFKRYPAVMALGQMIENWHISDFHISVARQQPNAAYAEHLSREGENLALVAQYLFEYKRDIFDKILEIMSARVPGITQIEAKTSEEGRVLLRFKDGAFKDPFLARYVSDGTIKMFAFLVLLYDPSPYPLLCVEEPENQLYPQLLFELTEEFSAYAQRGGQVFVSTHSPDFLNALDLENVFWLEKDATTGCSSIKRAKDDAQIAAFMAEGDQMGFLWKQGFFGQVDPQ